MCVLYVEQNIDWRGVKSQHRLTSNKVVFRVSALDTAIDTDASWNWDKTDCQLL